MTPSNENEYISLSEAAKLTPRRPSTGTIWRWARRGITARNGEQIHLRHARIGGRVYTTRAWLDAFFERVAEADIEAGTLAHPQRLEQQPLSVSHERADAELREAGL